MIIEDRVKEEIVDLIKSIENVVMVYGVYKFVYNGENRYSVIAKTKETYKKIFVVMDKMDRWIVCIPSYYGLIEYEYKKRIFQEELFTERKYII